MESVDVVRVAKGDVVVLEVPGSMTTEVAEELRRKMQQVFDAPVVVLSDGLRLKVLKDAASDAPAVAKIADKGIWSPTTTYRAGDAVSWRGSLWIAQGDTLSRRPGDGETPWRLAAKGALTRPAQWSQSGA